ncbi:hypothetical protein CXG81DRAFT_13492 [Caulochytrium protostelioides]|uniref:Uncharacterized protein n=1 Tax=Caulochytrium protostelioides TaxID=1555241 RepID=A0A4P9X517_9FUNG|nr:hypothetical protein CXG81DRAFT_13492 [Caulochytrium protostelioides]|eukprot:RKP00208.1 hypothetical protein CXG81DRAFT_13492 [Caulochytrium protostelioides]
MAPVPLPGAKPPSKEERQACWHARDRYFACLDQHQLWLQGLEPVDDHSVIGIDPTRPPIQPRAALSAAEADRLYPCMAMKQLFETACLPSWVVNFESYRVKHMQDAFLKDKIRREREAREKGQDDEAFWARVAEKGPEGAPTA